MSISYSRLLKSLMLPITVTILIPAGIIWLPFTTTLPASMIFLFVGLSLILLGLLILARTIIAFVSVGKGTLAPWDPPKELVVGGTYCYVRNPMISGVLIIITGESLMFNSIELLYWCILFFIINTINFIFVEEPQLVKRFGNSYVEYKKNVPRWIPRFSPWKPMS